MHAESLMVLKKIQFQNNFKIKQHKFISIETAYLKYDQSILHLLSSQLIYHPTSHNHISTALLCPPVHLRGTSELSSTRTCHLSLILNRFLGLLFFTCVTLPKSEASCLRVMLKNWSMPLLLLDWTTATHCQDVRIM